MLAGLSLVAVLSATACTQDASRYEDATEVASALRAGGIACSELSRGEEADLPSDVGSCESDEGAIEIYVFDEAESQKRWLTLGGRLGSLVVGPNWAIDAGDMAPAVSRALGGDTL